jgi:TM2 domain-containing membrane protein YozV
MRAVMGLGCAVMILLAATVGVSAQNNDAWIPGLASFVIPGVGQFINDQVEKAIWHLGITVALSAGSYFIATSFPFGYYYTIPLIGLVNLGWRIYSGLDAYNVAKDQGFTIGVVENGLGFAVAF